MTAAAWFVLVFIAVVALVVAAAVVFVSTVGPPVKRRVIVNLRGGDVDAFRGVLWQRRGRWLVLRDVEVIAGSDSTPAEGEVLVDRDQVMFLQFLP